MIIRKGELMGMNNRWIFILLLISFSLLLAAISFALTFTGKGCSANQVCDTTTNCDLFGNCNTQYSNCVACGKTTMSCPGGIASCDNTCEQVGASAQCKTCAPDCTYLDIRIPDPHVILKFNVFTKKNFITAIEPKKQTAIAGTSVNYKVTLENKHPKTISLGIGAEVPTGWSSTINPSLQMAANSKRDITFSVTSNASESDGSYPVAFVAFSYELGIFDKAIAEYDVASRGPPAVSVSPSTQEGAPGESLGYTVSVTNNDPADFDASTISFTATVPKDWSARFEKSSLSLKPGETSTTILTVKSPANADINSYTVNVNATANRLSASAFAEYRLTFCGNGICELDEACEKDCVPETSITCNGRCESEADDGVEFSAGVSFSFSKFVACSRTSKPRECLSAYESKNCGYGKSCLCGNDYTALCKVLCVDKKGTYYLYAKNGNEARTNANYSFACPYVNLNEIIQTKNNLGISKAKYEQARSAFVETAKGNATEKAKLQPCIDALELIVRNLTAHLAYMDAVIASPAKSNTTDCRRKTDSLRTYIEATYNKYCRGAEGLLRIENLSPPAATEKGKTAEASVTVKNLASFDYYGYVECDFLPPGGEKIVTKESCTRVSALASELFYPKVNATFDGDWKMKCRVYASLEPDCSTEIHDETDYYTFNVYSKDVYVVDVAAECRANDVLCSVRTNSIVPCSGCRIDDVECTKAYQNGTTTYFSCPKQGFYADIVGYVHASSMCNPVGPNEKNITSHCSGCGDNVTQSGEQCELPNTNNNIYCMQSELSCDGKRSLYRDAYGFCAPVCQCSADQFESACIAGRCGAQCSDAETRNYTLTNDVGSCICVQQCNSTCGWQDCYCEPKVIEVLGASVSDTCPRELTGMDVFCTLSEARVDCTKAKIGSTECPWTSDSYWYGNTAVFTNCAAGLKTNSQCGAGARNVVCYLDRTRCAQAGTNKTIDIDIMPSPTAVTGCNVQISSKSCYHDLVDDKYVAVVNADWSGGNYANAKIGTLTSNEYTASGFTYTARLDSSGTKDIYAYVYNANRALLCSNASTVYCSETAVPNITTPGTVSVEILGSAVSDSCPEERSNIDVICTSSVAKADCIKAKIGNTVCEWTNSSYWLGNDAVFTNCPAGFKTNSQCGAGSRNVLCYVDTTKCTKAGTDKTIGIDVVSATRLPTPSAPCSVRITSKNCSYDAIANRYNVYLGVSWSGGSYSRGEIQDIESRKYTTASFIYSTQAGGAGSKQLSAFVYDSNDNVLCANASDVYCSPENVGPSITNTSVEVLGIAVSDTCPEEKTYMDVICSVSIPKVDCIKAKIGGSVCEWTNSSYWYGSNAVFKDCAAGFKTSTKCGNQSREVRCYIDKTKCSQTGGDKTLGIDIVTAADKPKPVCEVAITSQGCAYDPAAKRYTASMGVKWSNGDHAHGKIGDQDSGSIKYTVSEFTYTYQLGTPGSMNLKAYVHDANDKLLCSSTSTIYCGAGNTTGVVVDVVRNMPDKPKPGWVDVKFDIRPYNLIQNFELSEYVEKNLSVADRKIEGNISTTVFGGPSTVSENSKEYSVYTWKTDLDAGKNATISYRVNLDKEGEYRFNAKVKFYDQERSYEKFVLVTSCSQTTPVLAKNAKTGACSRFPTACDVPAGYVIVETCAEPPPPPPQEGFDWLSLIIVLIVAIVLALAWVKREAIQEKIYEWRHAEESES